MLYNQRFKPQKLKKYAKVQGGYAFKSSEYTKNGIPVVRIGDLKNNTIDLENCIKVSNSYLNTCKNFIIKENDLLIAMTGATVGKVAFVKNLKTQLLLNQRVGRFICDSTKIDSKYLYYVVKSPEFYNEVQILATGAGQPNISPMQIENINIPVPNSIKEQQEIVQILDAMSDIICLREECISHAQALIPALFQEMYKGINQSNVEVRQLVNAGIIEKPLDGNHGELHPKSSDYVSQGIPFIMASDLINGKVDIYNCNFISEEQAKKLRKGFAKKDDVLLSHKGTIGRTAIVQDINTDNIVLTPQVTCYRILDDSKINKYYLKSYFDSVYFQNILQSKAQKGATRAYIGITEQLSLPIYLPDIKQQEQFANKVKEINSYIEKQQKELENAKQMFQSLLYHAFTGELTRRAYGKN